MRRCFFLTRILAVLLLPASWLVAADPQEVVQQVVQSSYSHYMTNLLCAHNGDGRGPYAAQHDLARANIQRMFSSFGLTTTQHAFPWRGGTFYNVVGLIPGKVARGGYDFPPGTQGTRLSRDRFIESCRVARLLVDTGRDRGR